MQKELTKYLIPDIANIVCEYATFDTDRFRDGFQWLKATAEEINVETEKGELYGYTLSANIIDRLNNLRKGWYRILHAGKVGKVWRECTRIPRFHSRFYCCGNPLFLCDQCKEEKIYEKEEKERLRYIYLKKI